MFTRHSKEKIKEQSYLLFKRKGKRTILSKESFFISSLKDKLTPKNYKN